MKDMKGRRTGGEKGKKQTIRQKWRMITIHN
jgi:hypothetical protein